jgi:predicted nucleic acid-binding protein
LHWALLDTGVYVGHWQGGLYSETLSDVRKGFIVRHSAVVLSELRRGARTREAQRLVEDLFRLARTIWWEAGKLVRHVGDLQGWNTGKRREFQNDVLIALTARRHGATVVTTNHRDFALLKDRLKIKVLYA